MITPVESSPRVSLLVGTAGRVVELEALLRSLALQTFSDFEVLVLDQNADDRLHDPLLRYRTSLRLSCLRVPPGLAAAHNAGLAEASGTIIAFPDDDCVYPRTLLADLVNVFDRHPEWDGVTVRCLDETGRPSAARWDRHGGRLTKINAGNRGVSTSIFLRRRAIDRIGPFDTRWGLGGAGSLAHGDADYLLRAVRLDLCVMYLPELSVTHPQLYDDAPGSPQAIEKRRRYGLGAGALMREHRLPIWYVLGMIGMPLLRAVVAAALGRWDRRRAEWTTARARAEGWWKGLDGLQSPPRR